MNALGTPRVEERPIFFGSKSDTSLFGIVTSPRRSGNGIGVLVLAGGGPFGSTHRNDLNVRICRKLADAGFTAMRFDWHGVGDSLGWVDRFDPDVPFVDDLLAASSTLRSRGSEQLLIVGSCFGARTALACAERMDGLEAMLLVTPPVAADSRASSGAALADKWTLWDAVRHWSRPSAIRGLSDPRRRRTLRSFLRVKADRSLRRSEATAKNGDDWISTEFLTSLRGAVSSGIRILFLYGSEDPFLRDFRRAHHAMALDDAGPHVAVEVLPGEFHGFDRVLAQEVVSERAHVWAHEQARLCKRAEHAPSDGAHIPTSGATTRFRRELT